MLARVAAKALDDKKGLDVCILDLGDLQSAPARFFVIASGNVPSHVCFDRRMGCPENPDIP